MKESSDPKKWFHRDLRWGHSRHSKISFDFYYEAAKFVSSGTLLDIGAGPRTYAPFFKQALYIALEHVDSGLSAKSITDSDIFVDSNEIPLRDNCVTGVLSSSSLEHFRDPELFFSESYRVLEPGGGSLFMLLFCMKNTRHPTITSISLGME